MVAWIQTHGFQVLVGYYVLSAAISSLPSPTADSTKFYQWFFKFSNAIAANISRAYSTAVEGSPNFQAAIAIAAAGKPGPAVTNFAAGPEQQAAKGSEKP